MQSTRFPALSIAAFAALAAHGSAQSLPVVPVRIEPNRLGEPGQFAERWAPTGDFGRIAVADFGADWIPDLVVAAEDTVSIVWGGAFTQGYYPLGSPDPVNGAPAFAIVRDAAGDRVALATESGLELWTVDAATWTLDAVTVADASYTHAAALAAGDIDGDGDTDLVGLTSAGTSAFVTYNNAGIFDAPSATFSIGGVGRAIEPLRWDGSDELELAVLRTDGLRVYRPNGTTVDSLFAGATNAGLLTVMRDASRDRAAWFEAVGAASYLRVCGRNAAGAPISEPPLSFGAGLQPTGLVSTDGNFDQRPDLTIVHRFSHCELVLQHLPINDVPSATGSFSFLETESAWLLPAADLGEYPAPVDTANPLSNASVAAADLDGDLDIDIAFPSEAFGDVRSILTDLSDLAYPENRLNPQFDPDFEGNLVVPGSAADRFDITAGFHVSTSPLTASATHLELVIWEADSAHLCTPNFADGPVVNELYTLTGLQESTDESDPRPVLSVTVQEFKYGVNVQVACHMRARLVRVVGGSIVQAWTPTFATFNTFPGSAQDVQCDTWLGAGPKLEIPLVVPGDAPTSGGSYTERPSPPVPPPPGGP